jgi:glycosyltransferase involved in cell wall biosynthesis
VPLLSVLLPARNAGPWVDAALASLLRQSVRDLEVVAVDDGSTDDTLERLERAAAAIPACACLRTEARGLPQALETARAHARGAFLARHDADDLSHRRRFELQLAHLAGAARGGRVRRARAAVSPWARRARACAAGARGTTRCSSTRRWRATSTSTARSRTAPPSCGARRSIAWTAGASAAGPRISTCGCA